MDSIAICILRRAICILQKFLGNMDIDSKPFLFRRKESILHLDLYCRAIWILFINNFLLEYGTSAHVIIRVFTHCFALLICIHFLIAVVIHHYF